jgi:hypothetical protein
MCVARRLTTLWAFTACYKDSQKRKTGRWEENINMDLNEVGFEGMDWPRIKYSGELLRTG